MTYRHVIQGDTDSAYLRLDRYAEAHDIEMTRDNMVELADKIQKKLQDDLPGILADKFVTTKSFIEILEPGREIVGRKALLKDKKKRYAIHVVDDEGKPVDKIKIMGMETRRSDTPVVIQEFLLECLTAVVMQDVDYEGVMELVDEFRAKFRAMDPWRRGSPGRVRNLRKAMHEFERYQTKIGKGHAGLKKPRMHVTVKAALNTNLLMEANDEHRWDKIRDGDKVEVIYLRDNIDLIDAVAIKTGELYVPEWFQILPFHVDRMEEKLIDRKLFNVLGDIMDWDFSRPKTYASEVLEAVDDFYD